MKVIIPILASILILGTIGLSQDAWAPTKIVPTDGAQPGHPFTMLDTSDGRLVDGTVAVFTLGGTETIADLKTNKAHKTAKGTVPDVCGGEYDVSARQPDGSVFDIGEFKIIAEPCSDPILFEDDYSTNDGWTQIGSTITVDSSLFPDVVKFNNAFGGQSINDQRVYKQIDSTLPLDSWIVQFDYSFTSSNIPAHYPLALTSTSDTPETQPGSFSDRILVYHGASIDQLHISAIGSSSAIPISANTQYYIQLERTPTELKLSVFSDPARTNHIPSSPVTLSIASTNYDNLNFVQHSTSFSSGAARVLTTEVDNTVIFSP